MSEERCGQQAEQFVRLLRAQKELYLQLRRLSDAQSETVSADDSDRLLSLLGSRQKLIDQLTRINRELAPFRDRWDDICGRMPTRHQTEARHVLRDVKELLTQILARDESDQKHLSARHAALGRQLDVASAGRRAHSGYRQQQSVSALNMVDARL